MITIDCEKDQPMIVNDEYQLRVIEINEDSVTLEIIDLNNPRERVVQTLSFSSAEEYSQFQLN